MHATGNTLADQRRPPWPTLAGIEEACARLAPVLRDTPLECNARLSEHSGARVYLKREDRQVVRSFKVRGAYNKIAQLSLAERARGVVCASAGNHAQGVAFACSQLGIDGVIYMPETTPRQKVAQVRRHGGERVAIRLCGQLFDEAYAAACAYREASGGCFVHPFDDAAVIEGQGTLGYEILSQADFPIDYLLLPVGGGGLAAGVSTVFRAYSPATRIIGVEPAGAPAMSTAIARGVNAPLAHIDPFADGAAVRKAGDLPFALCRDLLHRMLLVPERELCRRIIELYNEEGIVAEPAGVLSIAALASLGEQVAGSNVVCLLSGGNNDIDRLDEIRRRAGQTPA